MEEDAVRAAVSVDMLKNDISMEESTLAVITILLKNWYMK